MYWYCDEKIGVGHSWRVIKRWKVYLLRAKAFLQPISVKRRCKERKLNKVSLGKVRASNHPITLQLRIKKTPRLMVKVPDPDLEIKGGGGRSSRHLHKGGGSLVSKKCFQNVYYLSVQVPLNFSSLFLSFFFFFFTFLSLIFLIS